MTIVDVIQRKGRFEDSANGRPVKIDESVGPLRIFLTHHEADMYFLRALAEHERNNAPGSPYKDANGFKVVEKTSDSSYDYVSIQFLKCHYERELF